METIDSVTGEVAPMLEYRSAPDLAEFYAALAKAQGEIRNAAKDASNPHFKSRYADLASISDACRAALSKNGIAVLQIPFNEGQDIGIITRLGHSSGQWIEGRLKVALPKWDAQSIGSACTYLRRYSLAAMAGVAPGDDDDGEVGRGGGNGHGDMAPPRNGTRRAAPRPPVDDKSVEMRTLADTIKDEIDTADNLNELNAELIRRGQQLTSPDPKPDSDLAKIKAFSETAFQFLVDRANKKRGMLASAPSKDAA